MASPAGAQPVPGPESTLLLTWFDDPSTSMVVQWLVEGDAPPRAEGSAAKSAFEVPMLEAELVFDGDSADWGDAGLRTDYLPLPDGGWPDATGTMAGVRTAWTPEGLAVLVTVIDPEPGIHPPLQTDWGPRLIGDRVEFRMTGADLAGEAFRVQAARPAEGEEALPGNVTDWSRGGDPPEVPTGVALTDDGYVVETLLPWSAVPGLAGKTGEHLGLQVEVYDPVGGWWAPVALSWAGSAYPGQA